MTDFKNVVVGMNFGPGDSEDYCSSDISCDNLAVDTVGNTPSCGVFFFVFLI